MEAFALMNKGKATGPSGVLQKKESVEDLPKLQTICWREIKMPECWVKE